MSRKDIIIISVLVNAGLLAVLFITAIKTDSWQVLAAPKIDQTQIAVSGALVSEISEVALNQELPADEVDQVLREYLPEVSESKPQGKIAALEPLSNQAKEESSFQGNYVEVVVKRGDALEKIARANRTTVEAIKKASGLQTDKLKIGQVLKVPVGTAPSQIALEIKKPIVEAQSSNDPQYYVIKPGDNPWKIAKLHNVKFEALLTLNQLDEERAKSLKVGEKIRVR